MKICSTCKLVKSIDLFPKNRFKKDGYDYSCKECKKKYSKKFQDLNRDRITLYKKNYHEKNKVKYNTLGIKYRQDHLEERREKDKLYYKTHKDERKKYLEENKDKLVDKSKIYRNKNKENRNEYVKTKCKNDSLFKLKERIKCSIRRSFRNNNFKKECNTTKILSCSFENFKTHIESKFEPWMNWNNYGSVNGVPPTGLNQCWDIDHKIPLSIALTEEDIFKLNHYTNLQPLCSYTNRNIKKDKII